MGEHQEDKHFIIGIPGGEKREKGEEILFEEIMVENFSNRHLDPGSLESSKTNEPRETQNI